MVLKIKGALLKWKTPAIVHLLHFSSIKDGTKWHNPKLQKEFKVNRRTVLQNLPYSTGQQRQLGTHNSRNVTFPSDYTKPLLFGSCLHIISSTSGTKFWQISLPFQSVNLIFSCITSESAGTRDEVNRFQDAPCNHRAILIIWATFGNRPPPHHRNKHSFT